jgi:hypothetical protein
MTAPLLICSTTEAAPVGPATLMPATFIGEAATLAIAFAAPALFAGAYMALKRLAKRTSATWVVVMSVMTLAGGVALALGGRVDIFAGLSGS